MVTVNVLEILELKTPILDTFELEFSPVDGINGYYNFVTDISQKLNTSHTLFDFYYKNSQGKYIQFDLKDLIKTSDYNTLVQLTQLEEIGVAKAKHPYINDTDI